MAGMAHLFIRLYRRLFDRVRQLPGINRQSGLFLAHSAIYHLGLFGISEVLLNFYFVSLGFGTDSIGLFQSLPRIGSFLLGVPAGILAERIGARRVAIWGMAGVGVSYLILLFGGASPWVISLAMFLRGVSYGAAYIAANPLIMALTDRPYQTHLFSHFNVITMAATSLGSFIGGYLPALFAVWLGIQGGNAAQSPEAYAAGLLISGGLIFVSLVPLIMMREPRHNLLPAQDSAGGEVLAKAGVDAVSLAPPRVQPRVQWGYLTFLSSPFFIFGLTAGWTFPLYNLFFRSTFQIPDQVVGTILSVGWLGMALITILNPWLERRWGRVYAIGGTMTIAAIAFLMLSVASSLSFGIVAFVVAVTVRNMLSPLFTPLLLDSVPISQHNIVSSLSSVVWSLGWFIATGTSGFVQQRLGFGFMFQAVAAGVFLTGVLTVWVFRKKGAINAT